MFFAMPKNPVLPVCCGGVISRYVLLSAAFPLLSDPSKVRRNQRLAGRFGLCVRCLRQQSERQQMPGFKHFRRPDQQPVSPVVEHAAAPAAPSTSSFGIRSPGKPAASAPMQATTVQLETINPEDLPQSLKDDIAATPPTDLPHRMGYRPAR